MWRCSEGAPHARVVGQRSRFCSSLRPTDLRNAVLVEMTEENALRHAPALYGDVGGVVSGPPRRGKFEKIADADGAHAIAEMLNVRSGVRLWEHPSDCPIALT